MAPTKKRQQRSNPESGREEYKEVSEGQTQPQSRADVVLADNTNVFVRALKALVPDSRNLLIRDHCRPNMVQFLGMCLDLQDRMLVRTLASHPPGTARDNIVTEFFAEQRLLAKLYHTMNLLAENPALLDPENEVTDELRNQEFQRNLAG